MSVGPLGGLPASAAGSPLSQTKGSEIDRAQQDSAAHDRRVRTDQKAEAASGIGETDGEDHEPAERDADGRRLWEAPGDRPGQEAPGEDTSIPPRSRDATGQTGNLLDLSG